MPWNKIAGLFVEVEGPAAGAPPAEEAKEEKGGNGAEKAPAEAAPAPAAAAPAPPPPTLPGTVNEEMVSLLSQAIEAADIEGFDYIEFRNSLAGMAAVPMPEQQKFAAVFATAQTMGLTKDKLLQSIDHYLGVLEGKRGEFNSHVEAMTAQEVTTREKSVEQKEQEIAALTEQIQQATAAIGERQQEVLQLKNEIGEQKLNIQNTSSSFEATFNFVSGKLQEDKTKIDSYLG